MKPLSLNLFIASQIELHPFINKKTNAFQITQRKKNLERENSYSIMENTSLHNKSVVGVAVKEENKASHDSNGDQESCADEIFLQIGAGKRAQDDDGMKPSSPNDQKNLNSFKEVMATTKRETLSPDDQSESRSSSSTAKREQLDHQLGSTKAEMDEVMEENQRLKMYLDQILKDYRALQMQYRDVIQREAKQSPHSDQSKEQEQEPIDDLISLSLGRTSSITERIKHERLKTPTCSNNLGGVENHERLTLGLDSRFHMPKKSPTPEIASPPINPSPENSLEEIRQEEGDTWPPKTAKHVRSDNVGDHDEISQQNPTKRARVSVRVRCDTPTMNDGCQWRKYGQKIAKGNPCPRAYYRCTVAPSCPVRKQVQRCAEDMSILITTYEGTHNHPLPMSATAMASTTSAAASMLLSGSSTSATAATTATTTTTLNGLNAYLSSDNSRSKPYYLPNPSISSTPSFPTITLDLTSTTNSSSSTSSHLSRLANNFPSNNNFPPRYSTTNLNFSSLESNPLPLSWSNGMLSYGSSQLLINKNQNTSNNSNSLSFGSQQQQQPYESLYQTYMQKNTIPNPSQQQTLQQDTIAAATKAITSDPSFQSALAAALTSIIGGPNNNQNVGEKSGQMMNNKSSETFPILSSFPSTSNANKCPPHLMNKSSNSSSSSQPRDLMFLSNPFSNSKSKSNSPAGDNNKDQL